MPTREGKQRIRQARRYYGEDVLTGKPLDHDPCPMGCGRTTEDPYGGPCRECWKTAPSGERG